MAVRSVGRPNLCICYQRTTSPNILRKPLMLSRLQHSAAVGGWGLSPPYQLRGVTLILVRRW